MEGKVRHSLLLGFRAALKSCSRRDCYVVTLLHMCHNPLLNEAIEHKMVI